MWDWASGSVYPYPFQLHATLFESDWMQLVWVAETGLHISNSRVGGDLGSVKRLRGGHQITSNPSIPPLSAFDCYRLV